MAHPTPVEPTFDTTFKAAYATTDQQAIDAAIDSADAVPDLAAVQPAVGSTFRST